uniref:Uncharacterized protein n=1 Tax=Nonomuraea gerenzanensis TaxID=93944 RepID=A0A1M4E2V6_9ACTN|nr:hypothetical protein BN4615_P2604 [Nonomuraea gerenzanensis]
MSNALMLAQEEPAEALERREHAVAATLAALEEGGRDAGRSGGGAGRRGRATCGGAEG